MTLQDAIKHCHEVANSKCDECGKEHEQLAEWLTELAGFKDETPITKEWLSRYFDYFGTDENDQVWIQKEKLKNHCIYIYEMPEYRWNVKVEWFESIHWFEVQVLWQLRMFLTLCGLGDFVKQLK